jgi:hypothetical protein
MYLNTVQILILLPNTPFSKLTDEMIRITRLLLSLVLLQMIANHPEIPSPVFVGEGEKRNKRLFSPLKG